MARRRLAPILAVLFAVAAAFHAYALAMRSADDASPPWRHALFLAINAAFAVGFARRSRYLEIPAMALVAQQAVSHGRSFILAQRAGHWDLLSLAVLITLPVIIYTAMSLAEPRPVAKAGGQ